MVESLGRIRSSRRPLQGTTAAPDTGVVSEAIGNAIRGIATLDRSITESKRSVEDAEFVLEAQLIEQHKARQTNLQKSNLAVGFINLQTQLERDIEELRRDAAEDGSGFTESVDGLVSERLSEFYSSIPEDMRPEYEPTLAELRAKMASAAYTTEITAADNYYVRTIDGLLTQARSEIDLGQADIATWTGVFADLQARSPLDRVATNELFTGIAAELSLIGFQQEATRRAQNPLLDQGSLPSTKGGTDVAATGLPGPVRGMLNSGNAVFNSPAPGVILNISAQTEAPAADLVNRLTHTVEAAFGPGTTINITSGHEDRESGTRRHPIGLAADFTITLPDGRLLDLDDPRVEGFTLLAARNGITGIGFGDEYMGNAFHMDIFPPEAYDKEGHLWEDAVNVPGLLDTIKSRTEGNGDYGDFTSHPGGPAGRYLMDNDVWRDAAETLGLADFSPANQDRAAWWHIEQTYAELTGQDLKAVFYSADPVRIEAARQLLLQEVSGLEIPGMREMSAEAFYNQVTLTEGTASGLMYDERFASLPSSTRSAAITQAQTSAQQALLDQQTRRDRARQNLITDLNARISLGQLDMTQLVDAIQVNKLSPQEASSLLTQFEASNAEALRLSRFSAQIGTPGFFVNTGSDTEKATADNYSREVHFAAINEQGLQGVNEVVAPDVARMGWVPRPLQDELTRLINSEKPDSVEFGFEALTSIYAADPRAFERAFGTAVTTATRFYSTVGRSLGQDVWSARVGQMLSPYGPDAEANARNLMAQARSQKPEVFRVENIAGSLGVSNLAAPVQARALENEFNELMLEQFRQGIDADTAQSTAIDMLKLRWGNTSVGSSTYLMRRPPESVYRDPPRQLRRTIEEEVRRVAGLAEDAEFRLLSDHITEADISSDTPASYVVATKNELGDFIPLTGRDLPDGDPQDFMPVRMNFMTESRQVEELIERELNNVNARKVLNILDDLDEITTMPGTSSQRIQAMTGAREEIIKAVREAYAADPALLPWLEIMVENSSALNRGSIMRDALGEQ